MAKLYFNYSSMNAGKSTALLQANHNYHERGMKTKMFTFSEDTRFKKNEYEIYEPFENKHEDQILKVSKIPASISKEHFSQSIEYAKKNITINCVSPGFIQTSICLLYTSPSPRDGLLSRMPSSA